MKQSTRCVIPHFTQDGEECVLGVTTRTMNITILIGGYIAFLKGANSDKQPTPQCSCKLCDDTPEEPLTKQPKVYTTDCGDCAWRHPSNCKECPITINKANLKRAEDDGVVYPDGEDEIEERRRLR